MNTLLTVVSLLVATIIVGAALFVLVGLPLVVSRAPRLPARIRAGGPGSPPIRRAW